MKTEYSLLLSIVVSMVMITCVPLQKNTFRKMYYTENELLHAYGTDSALFLKAHDYYGNVFVFQKAWVVDTLERVVRGKGKLYTPERDLLSEGPLFVHIDSVALFETNTPVEKVTDLMLPKALIVLYNLAVTGLCISAPKACYGSCPTFYTNDKKNIFDTRSECFSNAISPKMEMEDIDDLSEKGKGCKDFVLTMKNEALETHMVNKTNLHIFPLLGEENILHSTDKKYYSVKNSIKTTSAISGTQNLTTQLRAKDELEYTSLADSDKLVTKEEMILNFPVGNHENSNFGLNLTFRQTLMTTYMLYHAISFMGDEYSDIMAKMENKNMIGNDLAQKFYEVMGGIDVYVAHHESQEIQWKYQGSYYETGPIAKNTQLCKIENLSGHSGDIQIKLIYNKGLWRFDEAALVEISGIANPLTLEPIFVEKNGKPDRNGLQCLKSDSLYLISLPGDEFNIHYKLPCEAPEYKIFLAGKGYYLEYMRSNWLADKNLYTLKKMFDNPKKWLNKETSKYKKYENQMESDFYQSRIDQNVKKLLYVESK